MKWPWNTAAKKALPGREELQPLVELSLVELFPWVDVCDVQAVLALIPLDTARLPDKGETLRVPAFFSPEVQLVTWLGKQLVLPYRVYVQEPPAAQVQALSGRQRQVLHCLYLRHHDGYLRQRHLEALLALSSGSPEDFTAPFTFSLLGEYVQEILAVLADNLTPARLASYVALIKENPLYWRQTQGRVASYWDVYYRRGRRGGPRFRHYVGARLLARLHQALREADGR